VKFKKRSEEQRRCVLRKARGLNGAQKSKTETASKAWTLFFTMMVLLAAGLSRALSSNTLSPPALRGQLIYRKGESASDRPITAVVGSSEIQAKLIPCASCHGRDGRGRPEGSVVPPSIRWEDLIRPRRIALGGERIPYNERLLIRAITMGFDPQGKPLNVAMPRYALSQADAQDLIAYLKVLSADYDPGLTDDIVRIGALLPPNSRYPGQAAAIQSALMGYFSDLNKGGGLYGRKIELICRELPPEPNQVAETYQEFLQKNQVFALLASYMAGAERQTMELLEEEQVPLIGAWTLLPEAKSSSNSHLFYLDAGLLGQSESLAAFALEGYARIGGKLAFVSSGDELSRAALTAARSKLERSPWTTSEEVKGPEDASSAHALTHQLSASGVNVLFLALRESQLLELLKAIKRAAWNPVLLIPGSLYSGEARMLQSFPGEIYLALSSLPSDQAPDASVEYHQLELEYGLPRTHLAAQFAALAEARILTEGLKLAGHDLAREKLLQSLEGLYDFPTGFSSPVTFGPTRRTGSSQFHIVTVDPATGRLMEVNHSAK
jgi:ABC-type branched-subunit amino acid transport system substrate-binding protein